MSADTPLTRNLPPNPDYNPSLDLQAGTLIPSPLLSHTHAIVPYPFDPNDIFKKGLFYLPEHLVGNRPVIVASQKVVVKEMQKLIRAWDEVQAIRNLLELEVKIDDRRELAVLNYWRKKLGWSHAEENDLRKQKYCFHAIVPTRHAYLLERYQDKYVWSHYDGKWLAETASDVEYDRRGWICDELEKIDELRYQIEEREEIRLGLKRQAHLEMGRLIAALPSKKRPRTLEHKPEDETPAKKRVQDLEAANAPEIREHNTITVHDAAQSCTSSEALRNQSPGQERSDLTSSILSPYRQTSGSHSPQEQAVKATDAVSAPPYSCEGFTFEHAQQEDKDENADNITKSIDSPDALQTKAQQPDSEVELASIGKTDHDEPRSQSRSQSPQLADRKSTAYDKQRSGSPEVADSTASADGFDSSIPFDPFDDETLNETRSTSLNSSGLSSLKRSDDSQHELSAATIPESHLNDLVKQSQGHISISSKEGSETTAIVNAPFRDDVPYAKNDFKAEEEEYQCDTRIIVNKHEVITVSDDSESETASPLSKHGQVQLQVIVTGPYGKCLLGEFAVGRAAQFETLMEVICQREGLQYSESDESPFKFVCKDHKGMKRHVRGVHTPEDLGMVAEASLWLQLLPGCSRTTGDLRYPWSIEEIAVYQRREAQKRTGYGVNIAETPTKEITNSKNDGGRLTENSFTGYSDISLPPPVRQPNTNESPRSRRLAIDAGFGDYSFLNRLEDKVRKAWAELLRNHQVDQDGRITIASFYHQPQSDEATAKMLEKVAARYPSQEESVRCPRGWLES